MKALLKQEKGLTLIEIVIVLGVGAVLTYFVTQVMTKTDKEAASMAGKNEFLQFENELNTLFNNGDRCREAFAAGNSSIPNLTNLGPPNATGTTPVTITLNTGNTNAAKGPLGQAYTVGSKWGNSLTIKAFEFTGKKEIGGTAQYMMPFHVAVSRRVGESKSGSETSVGGDILQKTFNLTISLDKNGRTVVGCAGYHVDFWIATGPKMLDILYKDGSVGVDIQAPHGVKLAVGGSVTAPTYQYHSDKRLKQNVRPINEALARLERLHGVMFRWKEKTEDQLGFVAQEVEKEFPEAVFTDPNTGIKSVAYANLLAPLIEGLKERQKLLTSQQREIDELKKALVQ